MNADELKAACVRAGLYVYRENVSRPWMVDIDGWGGIHLAHPCLPAYVAERLRILLHDRCVTPPYLGMDDTRAIEEYTPLEVLLMDPAEQIEFFMAVLP